MSADNSRSGLATGRRFIHSVFKFDREDLKALRLLTFQRCLDNRGIGVIKTAY